MKKTYTLEIAGLKRELPFCKISDDLMIASFVLLGDVELTVKCAAALIKLIPEFDVLITAEAKGIPLVHEIAKQLGISRYILARKSIKLYMTDPCSVSLNSITTGKEQSLYVNKDDLDYMKGKKVLVVDDVISTGQSVLAINKLVNHAGGEVVKNVAILAEGNARNRDDIIFLEYLPLFDSEGNELSD